MGEKLKSWAADDRLFMSIMIVLVALAAFVLGRLSAGQSIGYRLGGGGVASVPVSMTYTGNAVATATVAGIVSTNISQKTAVTKEGVIDNSGGLYVASKSGTKYHHRDCAGAKRIKDENRVYFSTEDDARTAGYEPAANCPQLNN